MYRKGTQCDWCTHCTWRPMDRERGWEFLVWASGQTWTLSELGSPQVLHISTEATCGERSPSLALTTRLGKEQEGASNAFQEMPSRIRRRLWSPSSFLPGPKRVGTRWFHGWKKEKKRKNNLERVLMSRGQHTGEKPSKRGNWKKFSTLTFISGFTVTSL